MKYFFVVLLFLSLSCKEPKAIIELPLKTNENLQFFGYTLVDTYWDDPTDSEGKTNYIDEVSDFTNIADILVVRPEDNIGPNLSRFETEGVKALIHLHEIFFERIGDSDENSLSDYDLRFDYQSRWDNLMDNSQLEIHKDKIAAFYLGEEPMWNNITVEDYKTASDYIHQTLPGIPIMLIEAYRTIDLLDIPSSTEWVGFDHYFIKDPKTDIDFQNELKMLKSKMNSDQKIVLILDAHFIDWAHGSTGVILTEMGEVAANYYDLANSDESIIGLIGYHWPSGFDFDESIGARHFPKEILDVHKEIGREITGK
ncbi:hypothetical protein N9B82_06250 [Saprospiraceae bacterium]|nr:hypothetical protein [Saprospiraceae bacterium]